MSALIAFIVYLVVLVAISGAVNWLLAPVFGRFWRIVVAPGVIMHELSHALACILTGAKVHEINVWKASGGHVVHGAPRLPVVGIMLVSYAPLLVMTSLLFWLSLNIHLPVFAVSWVNQVPHSFREVGVGYFRAIWTALRSLPWRTWVPWVLVYAMINVAVTITPSPADVKNSLWQFILVIIVTALIGQFIAFAVPLSLLWPAAATSLLFLGIALAAALVVAAANFLFRFSVKK